MRTFTEINLIYACIYYKLVQYRSKFNLFLHNQHLNCTLSRQNNPFTHIGGSVAKRCGLAKYFRVPGPFAYFSVMKSM